MRREAEAQTQITSTPVHRRRIHCTELTGSELAVRRVEFAHMFTS